MLKKILLCMFVTWAAMISVKADRLDLLRVAEFRVGAQYCTSIDSLNYTLSIKGGSVLVDEIVLSENNTQFMAFEVREGGTVLYTVPVARSMRTMEMRGKTFKFVVGHKYEITWGDKKKWIVSFEKYKKQPAVADLTVLNKHVIIALDNALHPTYEKVLCDQNKIQRAIAAITAELDLKEGDFYSFVNVGINEFSESISQLARPIKDAKGELIVWREFKGVKEMFEQGRSWYDMVLTQGINQINYMGRQFSLLTGSKAYSLTCTHRQGNKKTANKTYLVMVTDDHYNGNNNQNTEFNTMSNTRMSKQEFLAHCRNVAKYYNFQFSHSVPIDHMLHDAEYEAFLYEVLPSSSYALGTVINYPANLGLHRVKGGYRLQFPLKTISNEFLIKCFGLHIITNQGGKRVRNTHYFYPQDEEVSVLVPTDAVSERLEVEIEGWILQNDSIYGGVLLSPYDPLFSRLRTNQVLEITNEAKIYDILPIPDALWLFTDDCQTAVITWDIIFLLMFIAVICFIAYWIFNRITAYKPNNNSIRLRKYL